jgi:ABC-type multidrug transport system fused ATPase/permease subunit
MSSIVIRKISQYVAFARRCAGLLRGSGPLFLAFVALSVLSALTEGLSISLLVPILEAHGSGTAFAGVPLLRHLSGLFGDMPANVRIEIFAIAMAAVVLMRGALSFMLDLVGATMPLQWERMLNIRSFSALMAVDIAFINGRDIGSLQNGIYGWPRRVSEMLTNLGIVISQTMILAVYILLMLAVSWRLTGIALLFVIAISLTMRFLTSGVLRRAGEQISHTGSALSQAVVESMTGMKLVRLSAAEPQMIERYARVLSDQMASIRRTAKIQAFTAPLLSTSAGLFICVVLFASAVMHDAASTAWFSSMLLFIFLMFRLTGPVSSINAARNRIVSQMHALDMLTDFYRETEERRQSDGRLLAGSLRQGLRLEHVSFSYKPGDKPTLDDVSIEIARGEMVAVVGPSGAGKTTLLMLIARLYDPQSGRVAVDGVDLRELDVRSWRRRLAVVTQDTFIFNDTAANNISFGRGDVPAERVREAAEFAAAAEFIEALPQGYDTYLGDRGVRLSGGQQQRIAIARAVLADPDLIIFDEATSNLDTFTERAIQEAMEKMSGSRTVLVVAHRLSTIRNASKVLVMEEGRIVEQGTHRELLARRGRYWEMVEHQRLDLVSGDAEAALAEASA